MIKTTIQHEPIVLPTETINAESGAELLFLGHVRGSEDGKKITGLEYEYYEEMAALRLQKIAVHATQKFKLDSLFCIHRVGFIPIGEISLYVRIFSKHRSTALHAMHWFINEIKTNVPIWKWGVQTDGLKFPAPLK